MQKRRDVAQRALSQARQQGGLTLLVDGLAGMGKTFLLRELVNAAQSVGDWQVSVIRADRIESGEPYSFVELFAASGLIPGWFFTPDATTSPVPVARECVQRLMGEGATPPRLVVIDDAQWIDAESQRVLRYLIPRVTRRNMLFAFGVRAPHQPESFGEFLAEMVDESMLDLRVRVEPLTTHELTALVAERLGVGISPQTTRNIINETGGSFLEIDSLLSTLTPADISQLHVSWSVPDKVSGPRRDPLLRQFSQVSREAQATCEIVCLAGHELSAKDLEGAAALLQEPIQLAEGVTEGLLTISDYGASIFPRHALLGQAISATVTLERSRAVYRALAQVTTGYRSLRHTLRGTEEWTAELDERVNEYVSEAAEDGRISVACDVLRAQLELVDRPEVREQIIESLALLHMRAKNSYLMLDLLDEVEQLSGGLLHDVLYVVLAAHRVSEPLPQEAMGRLLAANPENVNERTVLAFFTFMVVILTMRSENLEMVPALITRAKMLAQQVPSDPAEVNDPRLRWMATPGEYLAVLDSYLMVQHQMNAEMDLVREALPGLIDQINVLTDGPLKADALVAVAGAQFAIGQPEIGHQTAKRCVELVESGNEPWAASTARLIYGHSLVMRGEYAEATEVMELAEEVTYHALDVETRSGWAALRVTIAAIRGEEHAEVFLEQARRQREFKWEGYSPELALIAECELGRVQGDPEAVLRASSGEWADNLANTRNGFLTYRAQALIELDRLDEAAALIDQLAEWLGIKWQEYWGSLDGLKARLAEATGDAITARWHYEVAIDTTAPPLARALTKADFGGFLLAQGRGREGATMVQAAIDELERIGGHGYLPRVHALLEEGPSVLFEAKQVHLSNTLTERERQIAQQLAKGRSNNQIAESLVVSVATVRSHVSNVLRKLRLTSRTEVAKALTDDE